jgi:hypothetical protein
MISSTSHRIRTGFEGIADTLTIRVRSVHHGGFRRGGALHSTHTLETNGIYGMLLQGSSMSQGDWR